MFALFASEMLVAGNCLVMQLALTNQPTDWLSTTMEILCTLKIMRALERAYLDELGALYY